MKTLLAVIAVLLAAILAVDWWTVVDPRLTRERIEKNEAAALACLVAIGNGALRYQDEHRKYPESLATLAASKVDASSHGCRVDAELAAGEKYGYQFEYHCTRADVRVGGAVVTSQICGGFAVTAKPIRDGHTGRRRFFRDETGVIRIAVDHDSGPYSDPLR